MCYCGVTKAILFITKRLIPTSDARQECGKFSDDRREKRENGAVQKDSHLRFRLHYRAGMLKDVLLQHLRSACSYTYLQKDNVAAQKRSKATNPFLTLKLRKNGGNDLLPAVLERPDSTFHLWTFVLKLAILHPEEVLVNPQFVEHFCRRLLGLLVRFVFLALKKTP